MKTENQYIIAYKGLAEGSHDFIFDIGKPFIEQHEYLDARDGSLSAKVHMVKNISQLSFTITIDGFLEVPCDRCLDYFPLDIHFRGNLYARFSGSDEAAEEDVILLGPEEEEIDLRQYLFESIGLSIPFRKIHPQERNDESGCNRDMLTRLGEHHASGDTGNHPMHDKLTDLM